MTTEAFMHPTRCGHSFATAAAPCAVFATVAAVTALTDPAVAFRVDAACRSIEHLPSVNAPTHVSHRYVTKVRRNLTPELHGTAATIGQDLIGRGVLSAPSHCGTYTNPCDTP